MGYIDNIVTGINGQATVLYNHIKIDNTNNIYVSGLVRSRFLGCYCNPEYRCCWYNLAVLVKHIILHPNIIKMKGNNMIKQQPFTENRKYLEIRAMADKINRDAALLMHGAGPELKMNLHTGQILIGAGALCRILQCRYYDLNKTWAHIPSYIPSRKMYNFNQICRTIAHNKPFIDLSMNRIH